MDNDLIAAPAQDFAPAGFFVRGGALLIDMVIILALTVAVGFPLGTMGVPHLVLRIAAFAAGAVYHALFLAHGGQTPGKMAAGVRVIGLDGSPIGLGRAFAREAARYLSNALLGLGYIPGAFGKKRTLHDYVGGTRAVYLEGVGANRRAACAALGVIGLLLPLVIAAALGFLIALKNGRA